MAGKKGLGIVFNWIFVLVAGTIIFIFLVGFAVRYKALAEKKINAEVALAIDNQLNALSSSLVHTAIDPEAIGFFETKFYCGGFSFRDFDVESDSLIFAPPDIRSDKLLVWVDDWKAPFKVGNLLFVSAPNIKYYFIADIGDKFAEELLDSMPRRFGSNEMFFNIVQLESGEINNGLVKKINEAILAENLREINFVLFNGRGANRVIDELHNTANKINAAVNIFIIDIEQTASAEEADDRVHGTIAFGDSENYFFGRELLIGGIFAGKNYECNLKEGLRRLKLVSFINREKVNSLWAKRQEKCQYGLIKSSFDKLIDLTENEEKIGGLYDLLSLIGKQNKGLYGKGCLDIF